VEDDTISGKRPGAVTIDSEEFSQLVEQVERIRNLIESQTNRINTLVHLLDTLNKRVERLEARNET
jgi:flagellar hook-associated protein FlgK